MVEATNRRLAEGGKVEGVMSEVRRMKAEPGKEADGEGGLVFEYGDGGDALTDTSEFSRRLQTRLKEQSEEHEQNREKAEATDRITKVALGRRLKREEGGGDDDGDGDGGEGGGEEGGVDDMDVEGGAGGGGGDAKGGVKSEGGGSGAKVDLEVDAFARAEPLASGGMAHVLALMRNKGDLVQEKEESHGRSNDPGIQGGDTTELGGYHKRGVKIEYRDEFGRLLKPKEAFRQMSYKFHNTEPGLKNQAKRLRQVEAELLAKQAGSNLSAVQKQSHMQAATGKAFLTLSGGAAGRVDASAFGRDDSFKDSLTKKKRKRKKDSA
jgi:U4/U6.U5 tri-snRNP-associated protein 1